MISPDLPGPCGEAEGRQKRFYSEVNTFEHPNQNGIPLFKTEAEAECECSKVWPSGVELAHAKKVSAAQKLIN